jgi:hypothetical protein
MGLSPNLNFYLQGLKLAAAEVFESDDPLTSLTEALDKLPTFGKPEKPSIDTTQGIQNEPTGFRFPYGIHNTSMPGFELVSHEPEF